MNQDQPINTSIENPPTQTNSSQCSGLDYRYCISPSTCDSGIYSNSEVPSSTDDDLKNIDEKLEHITDSSEKLILARQIIRKLKNDLQCLSKSERWYRNELKVQKKSRLDTLEKLYVNERDFLKTNQNLELECQKLRLLYNELKSKIKKDKELWLKQMKKDRKTPNQSLGQNFSEEATNYTIQKFKKIIEEHEMLIDVLRKQKQNLLTDLHNLTSEKDGKIMLLERKSAILEKENCMLVEKCKNFIIANQKLRETKDKSSTKVESTNQNEIAKLQTMLIVQNLEIENLKSRLLKLDEYKIENDKQKNALNEFKLTLDNKNCEIEHVREVLNKKELELFEIDKDIKVKISKIEELQRNLSKASEESHILCSNFSTLMHKILKIGEIYLKGNELNLESNNINSNLKQLLFKIKSELKPDYKKFKICEEFLETLFIKLNNSETNRLNNHIKSQELLSTVKVFKNIFDEETILMQISSDENNDDQSIIKNLSFNIEKTIKKNELLYDIFQQNFDVALCNKNNFSKFQDIFKEYNNFILSQNDTSFRSVSNFQTQCQSGNFNLKLNDSNQPHINIPNDLNELKALLVVQQEEHEKKINRHQLHVRCLMSNFKSSKNKYESLNNKYQIALQKCETLDKVVEEKDEIENNLKSENNNLQKIVANLKIENQKYLKIINNLQYQIKTIVKQLNEDDTQRRMNNDLKNNLTTLINDYKTIIKNNQIICESVKSNINYDNIYDLIYRSNNCVPNIQKLCKSVNDIKNDVNTILRNHRSPQYNGSSALLINSESDTKYSNYVQDQRKSLLDELKEASSVYN